LAQRCRELQSTLTAANDDRLNRGRAIHQAQADLCGTLAETRDQLAQMLTPPVLAPQQLKAFQGGAGDGRWLAGCIDVGPGKLDQRLDQLLTAGNEGTGRTKGLAQRAD